jgi:hypothetical protein
MFIEIGTLSLVLAASAQRCGPGKHVLSLDSFQRRYDIAAPQEPNLLNSATLESAVAMDLALVPDIRHVLVERADDNLLVWIAVDNPTKEIREKIFNKQYGLIEGFPEISFDFNLVFAKDRIPSEFASGAKLIYSREG